MLPRPTELRVAPAPYVRPADRRRGAPRRARPRPSSAYAVDSQQTKLIRRLAPHCEHRLFLSATPHNGYPESFTALLELIDDQRFARGVEPDEAAARRDRRPAAEGDSVTDDGRQRRFRERRVDRAPRSTTPTTSARSTRLLDRFAELRAQRVGPTGAAAGRPPTW